MIELHTSQKTPSRVFIIQYTTKFLNFGWLATLITSVCIGVMPSYFIPRNKSMALNKAQ